MKRPLNPQDNSPFTLGITGGIGSGKSTVCQLLEKLGVPVFYADAEAKRLMVEDPEARAEIRAAFGPDSYTPDGHLNRAYLAGRVFGDAEQLARLNAIVHPRVYRAFEKVKGEAAQAGIPLLAKEAALIFESGGDRFLDAVLVVDAPLEVRVARVVARDDVTPAQVHARMQHQLPSETLRQRADYVLENTGGPDDLCRTVESFYYRFLQHIPSHTVAGGVDMPPKNDKL